MLRKIIIIMVIASSSGWVFSDDKSLDTGERLTNGTFLSIECEIPYTGYWNYECGKIADIIMSSNESIEISKKKGKELISCVKTSANMVEIMCKLGGDTIEMFNVKVYDREGTKFFENKLEVKK